MTTVFEPIHLEFNDGMELFLSPRFNGMSVSYALGEFNHREIDGVTIPEYKELSETSRWSYIRCEVEIATLRTRKIMQSTNLVLPGPTVAWSDWAPGSVHPILSTCTSVAVPDEAPMQRVFELLSRITMPTSVINEEISRILHVRWCARNYGEPK